MKKLLTAEQVARGTIYQWTHAGYIPHCKFGKKLKFSKEKVLRWLKKKEVKGRSAYKLKI